MLIPCYQLFRHCDSDCSKDKQVVDKIRLLMFSVPELRTQIWKGARIVWEEIRGYLKSSSKNKIKYRNHLQMKNWRNRPLKEEIEKKLGFREKNQINVGFAPLAWASHPNTQEHSQENLTEKFKLFIVHLIHWVVIYFPITTDVRLNFNKRNK